MLAVVARVPGGMESKPRTLGHTNAFAWNDAQDHGAGRKAGTINDDAFAGCAQLDEALEVGAELPPGIAYDAHRRRRRRRRDGCHCAKGEYAKHDCTEP